MQVSSRACLLTVLFKVTNVKILVIQSVRESNGNPLQYSCLENPMDGEAWWAAVHGVAKSRTRLSDFTFTFHFHVLEKEMATHSSVLAWRIPGTGEPGGLPPMGSHRVRHDWSNLAAAAAIQSVLLLENHFLKFVLKSIGYVLGEAPGGSDGQESACNAEDPGLIPGLERSPGEGNGNSLQYCCLENSMY